jgi:hypothetical protein
MEAKVEFGALVMERQSLEVLRYTKLQRKECITAA